MYRKSKGSMILLVILAIGVIACIALCVTGFSFLLFMRSRAQYVADATALALATKFNIADRIGGINQLQAASRELIFITRQHCDQCSEGAPPELPALCNQLLEDAYSGHSLVEKEQQNQISLIRKEVQDTVIDYNTKRNKDSSFAFLGMKTFEPQILHVDLGRIAKVDSSVKAVDALPELAAFDDIKGYVNKTSKLYKCDINAKLPVPDSNLEFNFSSLPAYIGQTISPSRNTNPYVFVPYGTVFADGEVKYANLKQIPSAIQINCNMNVITPWDQSKNELIKLIATGTTSGASLESK